ncbi:glycosyltransferase N-terminal domain-containing protein [Desulfogranum marinum]|uniref:3-deoxy-D-manno-octulosonic acid transferase n=1 Tax=Desulfogranum marinum TaxID=453220 RepID=UPI0029C617E4|nr:glycosyltransferase N-terminal domain-containing protein [Desulfogranum marinum]
MLQYCTILLYNLIVTLGCLLLLPLLLVGVLSKQKYRTRIAKRLGWGLPIIHQQHPYKQTIWIHALSVGETTSALPLVKGLRAEYPDALIVFSTTTRSGQTLADTIIKPHADAVIAAPLDFLLTINLFIRSIQPDIFILTETDFWPNWLFLLNRQSIPTVLVNGRISQESFIRYRRFAWFFKPLFSGFTVLSMQTANDCQNLQKLGITSSKIHTLGNLKLDTLLLKESLPDTDVSQLKQYYGLLPDAPVLICGSTHDGEETILFNVFARLKNTFPELQLIVAPRDIGRSGELLELAHSYNFRCAQKTSLALDAPYDLLILDTLGELAAAYQLADAAFIGGSLVALGGHNPLEAAVFAIPVFFGIHMEDFSEIAAELVHCGGGIQVPGEKELLESLTHVFADALYREEKGKQARQWVRANQGVVRRHLDLLLDLLPPKLGK